MKNCNSQKTYKNTPIILLIISEYYFMRSKEERENICWQMLFLEGYNPAFKFICMTTPNFLINATLKTKEI